uniref:Putative secreted protein n=1 Tax=Ixodes ricinus TaxID=34613 RepID=A0A6B0UQZ2_IXORI
MVGILMCVGVLYVRRTSALHAFCSAFGRVVGSEASPTVSTDCCGGLFGLVHIPGRGAEGAAASPLRTARAVVSDASAVLRCRWRLPIFGWGRSECFRTTMQISHNVYSCTAQQVLLLLNIVPIFNIA